jgi:hypothetical protein
VYRGWVARAQPVFPCASELEGDTAASAAAAADEPLDDSHVLHLAFSFFGFGLSDG